MDKLSGNQYEKYWAGVHRGTGNDMAAVCFPDKPAYFNAFFDRVQKRALSRYLRASGHGLERARVLDVGCGRGRWLEYYRSKHEPASTVGVDISPEAVAICKAKGFKAVKASITRLPFKAGTFDFVSSITVLLHLPTKLKKPAAAEIARVLKPGGRVFLIESTWADPSPHVFGLPVEGWVEVFGKVGLRLAHRSAHCFNVARRFLPNGIPARDCLAIHLDYPLEYGLMRFYEGSGCSWCLQHVMVFEK